MKRALSMVMAIVMMVTCGAVCFASGVSTWDLGTASKTSTLTISGTTATCKTTFTDNSGDIDSVTITQTLQKKTLLWWNEVDTWENTYTSSSVSMTNRAYSLESGTYRLKSDFYVELSDGSTDEVTENSTEKTVS